MLRTAFYLGSVTAIVLASPASAVSTPIAGPGSYPVGATTVAEEPDIAGLVLVDLYQPFVITGSAGGSAHGAVHQQVIRSDLTGFLHFDTRLIIDSAMGFDPGSYVEWLELDPVATGEPIAVGRQTDGIGTPTSTVYDLAGTGMSRFDYNLIDLDGSTFESQFHILKTKATAFALTGKARVEGYEFVGTSAVPIASDWFQIYAPAAVPEPATWGLMIAGFAMVGFGLRRRRAAAA